MSQENWFKRLEEQDLLVDELASLGWAFWPYDRQGKPLGFFDQHALRTLADEIERRNKPFWDEYERYCAEQPIAGVPGFEEDFIDYEPAKCTTVPS